MRKPFIEHRPRDDGSIGYRLKWWEPDRKGRIRCRSLTFDDPAYAQMMADAIDKHGSLDEAAAAITTTTTTAAEQGPTP